MKDITAIHNNSHNAQGYVGYDPDTNLIVVAVRKTEDILNIISDIQYWKVNYTYVNCPGCEVEKGFMISS
jgi:uncharacterized protein (UPF0212 family)